MAAYTLKLEKYTKNKTGEEALTALQQKPIDPDLQTLFNAKRYKIELSIHQKNFNNLLMDLYVLIEKFKEKKQRSYGTVLAETIKLKKTLREQSDLFFSSSTTPPQLQSALASFKENCKNAIDTASDEFKKHRGLWYNISPILRKILGILSALTILPALFITTTKQGYSHTFFSTPKTHSSEQLDKFTKQEKAIEEKIEHSIKSSNEPSHPLSWQFNITSLVFEFG